MKIKILKEPMCFAQFFCLIIAILCVWFAAYVFSRVMNNPAALHDAVVTGLITTIVTGIFAAFAACYKYITSSSASSQAKDDVQEKMMDKMRNDLANSTPIVKPAV